MEAASSAILNTLPATTTSAKLYRIHRKNFVSLSYLPLITPRTPALRSRRVCFSASTSFSSNTQENPCQEIALLLEVEGVLMDIYRFGNRQAFNVAFQKLGLDCASWTQPVYQDLVKKSIGDEERMLILYFNRIGWPTSLPTNEKEAFLKRVLREKKNALDDLVISKTLPLRPGVETFIDEALEESIPVVMLTAYSKRGDKVARSIVEKLGSDRMSKMKIIGDEEVKRSFYGQLVLGKGVSSDLGELLAKEANKAVSAEEQKIAKEVASMLKLSVDIDTTSTESFENIVAALRAGAEYADTPVDKCILVAGSLSGVTAAERIGMPRVVVRSSVTARAEFTGANAVMDGFGGADLTISRLRQIQKS
ncbi:PREDICTED: haloacid dehalogenase-like hydrolase domain-containing protein At3g48420 [Ipomoea nil]|uniref:haloacid dehalogenase-like hydrolase domain-containing protein At3g48420 n=1 Tax=Ipomoea nil TaxID=35883 RepID=UPI000900D8D5|nr:PREDICTED: haloacid dehalogenase-like hydrolase domain-containing protein At3g48420 [Ipomoea nil]